MLALTVYFQSVGDARLPTGEIGKQTAVGYASICQHLKDPNVLPHRIIDVQQ